ncbi:MAG: response regulator, partial [Thermoleophilaceae bacterium]|nr:response regulator [Thermoleophilaceae bacterium]
MAVAEVLEHAVEDQPGQLAQAPVGPEGEVLDELRADPDLAGVPVILLTSRGQDADLEPGFDAGATDYVVKPFSPEELRQ